MGTKLTPPIIVTTQKLRDDDTDRIAFTNIAARGFDARGRGYTEAELMDRIQGILPDGTRIDIRLHQAAKPLPFSVSIPPVARRCRPSPTQGFNEVATSFTSEFKDVVFEDVVFHDNRC